MKRLLLLFFAISTTFSLLADSWTDYSTGITWQYTQSQGKVTVGIGIENSPAVPKSTKGDLVIPDFIAGYPVVKIASYAFYQCESIRSLTIPASVTSIGMRAFGDCRKLKSVNIPDGITSIGPYTFAYCEALTSITLPEGVIEIGESAFQGCTTLNEPHLPSTLKTIGVCAFVYCSSLQNITIPDGVIDIGDGAFSVTGLKVLTLPESVLSCYELREITTVYMKGNVPAKFSAMYVDCVYYTKQYASQWEFFFRNAPEKAPAEWYCMDEYVNVIVSPATAWAAPFNRKAVILNEKVSITAEATDGYIFLGWGSNQPGIGGMDAALTFTMPETEVTLVAMFLPKALIEGLIDEKIDGRIDGESLLTKEQAEAKTEATIEEKKEAGELFDQTGVDAKVEATITEKVDNKELVTRESIQEMALGTPIIEVENAQAKVGISLKRASTLDGEWEEVTLDVGAAEVDNGTVKVSVPAEADAAFYKFVVPDGLQTPAQEETP